MNVLNRTSFLCQAAVLMVATAVGSCILPVLAQASPGGISNEPPQNRRLQSSPGFRPRLNTAPESERLQELRQRDEHAQELRQRDERPQELRRNERAQKLRQRDGYPPAYNLPPNPRL